MDAFSIAISIGLQYGVPLETYVAKFVNLKFEPSGMTNDPDIRFASSLLDYVFRRLALDYLPADTREGMGIRSIGERTEAAKLEAGEYAEPGSSSPQEVRPSEAPMLLEVTSKQSAKVLDAPLCYQCGSKMQPAGSCYVCGSCGSTSGCS
jgi:ribonucleoside-diphosphate reductase alpha chain